MDKIKLKPCPFCGGPAEIVDNSRYDPGTYFVGCWWCADGLRARRGERRRTLERKG